MGLAMPKKRGRTCLSWTLDLLLMLVAIVVAIPFAVYLESQRVK